MSCWCERGELNPHGLPRQILSLMRLPFRHSRTHGCACMTEQEWSRCRDLNPGPLGPEPSALPNCATPRPRAHMRHTHSIEHGSTPVKRFPDPSRDPFPDHFRTISGWLRGSFQVVRAPNSQIWRSGLPTLSMKPCYTGRSRYARTPSRVGQLMNASRSMVGNIYWKGFESC